MVSDFFCDFQTHTLFTSTSAMRWRLAVLAAVAAVTRGGSIEKGSSLLSRAIGGMREAGGKAALEAAASRKGAKGIDGSTFRTELKAMHDWW